MTTASSLMNSTAYATPVTVDEQARDEEFWGQIAAQYDLEPGPVNFEHGYFGRMTRGALQDYEQNLAYVNRSNSVYVRQQFDTLDSETIRADLASLLNVPVRDVALTRSASESVQSLIRN
jgi:isopenicillin-N epimerase